MSATVFIDIPKYTPFFGLFARLLFVYLSIIFLQPKLHFHERVIALICTEHTEQRCVSSRDFHAATSGNLCNTTAPNTSLQGGKMPLNVC